MFKNEIKLGKWYMIEQYGYEDGIKGKVVEVCGDIVIMKFFWGNPWRSRQAVKINRLVCECKRPSIFSNH